VSLISGDLSRAPDKMVVVNGRQLGPSMGRDSELGMRRASTLLISKVICSLTSRLTTAWIVEVLNSDDTSAVSKSGLWKFEKRRDFQIGRL
jgi:hypothetical protein